MHPLFSLWKRMNGHELWGVSHSGEEEREQVLARLLRLSPRTVGLELPLDYERRAKHGFSNEYFPPLASALANHRIQAIPLEDPALYERHAILEVAKSVRQGEIPEAWVRAKKEYYEDQKKAAHSDVRYLASEEIDRLDHVDFDLSRFASVVDVLEHTRTLEDVVRLWKMSITERDLFVLSRVQQYHPSVVVIGDAHAQVLREHLPQYAYKHLPSLLSPASPSTQ